MVALSCVNKANLNKVTISIISYGLAIFMLLPLAVTSQELWVGKACPVTLAQQQLGILVISQPWFHSSRSNAAYVASDNATGIGVEIHFFANARGDTRHQNIANCQQYRIVQARQTTARLFAGEKAMQLDLPEYAKAPFYDAEEREFGRGSHQTPIDDSDKPWQGRVNRASTVAIYDTPYVSDSYGQEGQDIKVLFETCVVCQRDASESSLLSCLSWGYEREFMGGQTGWSEPEALNAQCQLTGSKSLVTILRNKQVLSDTEK